MKQPAINYDENEILSMRESEIRAAEERGQMGHPYSAAMFGNQTKPNIIEWQLDFRDELEDIERLLKCDVLVRDKDGNDSWQENPDADSRVFNQRGVNDILRYIILLVNKYKVLSNYNPEEVRMRVKMLGHELRIYIYNNYEKYGIDNEYKINNYPMMVLSILDVIEAAYRRALNGETAREINQTRIVQQTEPLMPQNINFYPGMGGQKKGFFSKLNPTNWGRG